MMSSFSPRGASSASTSVTKPYLYSWVASSSIVLVSVLMRVLATVGPASVPAVEMMAVESVLTGIGGRLPVNASLRPIWSPIYHKSD